MYSQWYHFYNELTIRFSTDNPKFFDFVEQTHGLQKAEPKETSSDLDVQVYFSEKNTRALKKKIAYNTWFDEGEILYQNRGLSVHAKQGEPFTITAHVWNEPVQLLYQTMRFGLQGAKQGKYLEVQRKTLLLPLFYLLEKRGYALLHGSAVLHPENNKAYIFLGANYVGKTTTTLDLVHNHNFGFLADNYIVIKDNTIYPFPENIRATQNSLSMLAIETKKQAVSEKHSFKPVKKIRKPCQTNRIFFMQLGPESEVTSMDFAKAQNRLNASHNYLGEFPEYSYLAFFPDFPPIEKLQKRVADFLNQPSLELYTFQSGLDIKKNMETLLPYLT
jgi:hypothetical protein